MIQDNFYVVLNHEFWSKVDNVCKVIEPLVHVLKVVDQDTKPTMPIIYETIDKEKGAISNKVCSYKKF